MLAMWGKLEVGFYVKKMCGE